MLELKKAVSAWKMNRPDGFELSPASRSRVLRSAMNGSEVRDMPGISSLFPAYHRIALAALLPAGLLAVVLVFTLGGRQVLDHGPAADLAPAAITVEKAGNQVVFNIANGGTVHSISKSNTPDQFDPGKAVRITDGSYRDSMIDDGDLVFYRID